MGMLGRRKARPSAEPAGARRRGASGLPAKWAVLQGVALLVLALAVSALLHRGESIRAGREAVAQGRSMAELIGQAAGDDVSLRASSRLIRLLECATRGGELEAAAILDGSGRVIAHTDVSMTGREVGLRPEDLGATGESAETARVVFGASAGRIVTHPLVGTDGIIGTVAIQLPHSPGPALGPDLMKFFLPAGILLLAFIVVTQATIRWAVRPTSEFLEKLSGTLGARGESEGGGPAAGSEPDEALDQTVTRIGELMETRDGLMIKNRLIGYEKRRMEMILDNFPDGLFVTNTMKEVVYINRQAKRYLGIHATDDDEAAKPRESAELARLVRETEKSGHVGIAAEIGGVERKIAVSRSPLTSSGGRTAGTLYLMRDATAQDASQRAQAEFLSQVTHELKAPLNTVITFVEELAENDGLSADERKDYFNTLNAETNRMAQLISNLLQLSRIQLGNLSVNFALVKPAALVRAQAESLRHHAESRGIALRATAPENLPAVAGDKDLLAVAVTNLISNAIKYTGAGGAVSVQASVAEGGILVVVEDTGIGIPEKDHARIFERFYRSDQTEVQEKNGTGLGLALVKEIVEMHGGKISLESTLGEGSRFRIWLPGREAGSRADVVEVLT